MRILTAAVTILLGIVFFCSATVAAQTWRWQLPLPQRVATLVDGPQSAEQKSVHWYGINDDGMRVASGVYFYRPRAGDVTEVKKMVLVM